MSKKSKASAEVNGSEPFAEARGCAALDLIREMLEALESAEDEMTCGWREPLSTRLTLADVQPAIRKAKKYLKQHNGESSDRESGARSGKDVTD